MPRFSRAALFWFAALALALTSAARAQVEGYVLDPATGQWVLATIPAEAGTDEALINDARRHLAEGRPAQARNLLDPWLDRNERSGSPLLPQAYLLRGDALTASGNEYKALYDYEAVAKGFPATEEYVRAVERELDIGVRYVNGYDRRFLGMRILDATDIGEELLIRVQERLPSSRLAERAGIELADFYYRNRDLEMAQEAYRLFIENYPRSSYLSKAMKRRVYASIAGFKGPRYDATPLIDAAVLIKRFESLYPAEAEQAGLNDALLARLDESAADTMYETADWYLRTGDEVSAKYTLTRLVQEHPRTTTAAAAMDLLVDRGWMKAGQAPPPRPVMPGPSPTPREQAVPKEPDAVPAPQRPAPRVEPAPVQPPVVKPPVEEAPKPPAPPVEPRRKREKFVPGTPLEPRRPGRGGESEKPTTPPAEEPKPAGGP